LATIAGILHGRIKARWRQSAALDVEPGCQQPFRLLGGGEVRRFAEEADTQGKIVTVAPWPASGVKHKAGGLIIGGDKKILSRHQAETGLNKFVDEAGRVIDGIEIPRFFKFKGNGQKNQFQIFLIEDNQGMIKLIIPSLARSCRNIQADAVADRFKFLQVGGVHSIETG